jgi:minor extracellular serine protease Vpr
MQRTTRTVLLIATATALACTERTVESESRPLTGGDPVDVSGLAVAAGEAQAVVDPRLARASGRVDVVVGLTDAPLSVAHGRNAKQQGGLLTPAQQRTYLAQLAQKQDALVAQVRSYGGQELGRVSKAHNAVVVSIDASQLAALAATPGVKSIRPVVDYELDLSNTVPYIGAAAVQATGFNGAGVRVAVLDSGIDYTHAAFGGAGTIDAYKAVYGTTVTDAANKTIEPGSFPTAKVVGGYDFVGERWPNATGLCVNANNQPVACPREEDPDPIDCGPGTIAAPCAGGHGSHVGDIIAGAGGVAPGASLYAVKVCSAVSTSCNGVALLLGIDFALDPDRDGDISDAVDVVNLSLGSSYGQREDDLSAACANAVRLGVNVVASAGNSADRPYIAGSPSTAPEVISVAQTTMPTAVAIPLVINSPAAIAGTYPNTATVSWAPVVGTVTNDVVFIGRGCPAGSGANVPAGGDPFLANPAGKIALIDRGECSVSLKVDRAADAGATAVLIGLVAAGDPVTFSFGGGDTMVSTLVITQALANSIKANIAAPVNATISDANPFPISGSMASTSSRGPGYSFQAIKPDIGAPGASFSAQAGTGNVATPFSGTSGAAPMVSGSVALLVHKYPARTPAELKALLMNTAETDIYINKATQPGVLAPITRIGGGEVRVDAAAGSTTAAWDATAGTPSLSFGYYAVVAPMTLAKTVRVRNYGATSRRYTITPSFRYADDAASGAVTLVVPGSVSVPANGSATFKVQLKVDPSKLPVWTLNGGQRGGDGFRLQGVEFDGYLDIADATDSVHLPWHILPHRAAAVSPAAASVTLDQGAGTLALNNTSGALDGRLDVFSLLGTSGKVPNPQLPADGDNIAVIDLRAVGARMVGIGGGQFGIQFAVNTFGQRSHPAYPAQFIIEIDTNRDGTAEFAVYNQENGTFASTGQTLAVIQNLTTGAASAFFFADADLDSANVILTAPLSAVGLTPTTQFDFSVYAADNYFTGFVTDAIEGITYTAGAPRFVGSGVPAAGVPAGGSSTLSISAVAGGDVASPSQTGLLLMYRDSNSQKEASAIAVQ